MTRHCDETVRGETVRQRQTILSIIIRKDLFDKGKKHVPKFETTHTLLIKYMFR